MNALRRAALIAGVLTPVLAAALWWGIPRLTDSEHVIVAVGDMACSPRANAGQGDGDDGPALCRQDQVSAAMLARDPEALLALGDLQYEKGAPGDWEPYARSYGRMRDITRPVPGNHEYLTADARGYYEYFGERAGPVGLGYYAYRIGDWRILALNSECTDVGGCGIGSPQMTWMRAELAKPGGGGCTLAYWHIPRFSSGQHGDHDAYRTLWRALAAEGVDLILAGHDHNYERLAPMDADGRLDPATGIRSFVVGTGGRNLRPVTKARPGSERVIDSAFGFLELRLGERGYRWRFVDEHGRALDQGEDRCH